MTRYFKEHILLNLSNIKNSVFKLSKIASIVALGLAASNSYAGGFSLYGEGNGKNAGDFAAGAASEAEDASTLYYNPAGLVHIKGRQLVLGTTIVNASSKLGNNATLTQVTANFVPGTTVSLSGLDTNKTGIVPAFFYSKNISDKLTLALGVIAPFGLATEWSETSNARYSATLSNLEIINVSPGFGAKITDNLSFGAAFDIQYAKVDFNSYASVAAGGAFVFPTISTNHGDSIGFGGHLGFLYQVNKNTRLGLNYQSPVGHKFTGKSTFNGPLASNPVGTPTTVISNSLFSDPVSMPGQITFSGTHILNSAFTFTSTVAYVQWNVFKEIVLNNVASISNTRVNAAIPENFKNTWRLAAGAKYKVSDKVKLRAGVGFDQTPTNNVDRNLRLPDSDRVAVAIGGHYQATKTVGLDIGWTHLFLKNTAINNTAAVGANTTTVVAGVKARADLLGAQLTWQIS